MNIETDNVTALPVTPRPDPGERPMLQEVGMTGCNHFATGFQIDMTAQTCKCAACGEAVSPWFVLDRLMSQESRWMRTRAAYQDEMRRLEERSSTKCNQCGEMTRISRR